MTDQRHYAAHARKPVPGTLYDFLVCGFAVLASSSVPTLDVVCDTPTAALTDAREHLDKAWLLSSYVKTRFEDRATDFLRSAGVVDASLQRPFSDGVARAVAAYVRSWRLELSFVLSAAEEADGAGSEPPLLELPAHLRVLAHAGRTMGNAGAATYLNNGARGTTPGLLTRDHVHRAGKRYLELQLRRVNGRAIPASVILDADMGFDLHWFHALGQIHNEAIVRPEFKSLRGAELALRLHDLHCLPILVDHVPDLSERAGIYDRRGALTRSCSQAQLLLLARLPRSWAWIYAA